MTLRRSTVLLASSLLALIPAVTSCGGGRDPGAASGTEPAAEPRADGASPIEAAFGTLTDPDELSEIYGRAYTNHAETTQRCLNEAGFGGFVVEAWPTPTPADFETVRPTSAALADLGYGVGGTLAAQADLLRRRGGTPEQGLNAAFLASLSESDTAAFAEQLNACTADAWERYPLPDSYPAAVAAEVEQVRSDALGSAEVAAAWTTWSACMAAAGYHLTSRDDAVATIQERAAAAEDLITELGGEEGAPSPDRLDELDALIAPVESYEREVVAVDVACAGDADIERTIAAAVTRYENDWLDANRDRVALILAERPPNWWEE